MVAQQSDNLYAAVNIKRMLLDDVGRMQVALSASRSSPSERIHQARKSCKRWRSYLHLLEPGDRYKLKRCDRTMRSASRALSDIRDARVLAETKHVLEKGGAHPAHSKHTSFEKQEIDSIRRFGQSLEKLHHQLTGIRNKEFPVSGRQLKRSFRRVEANMRETRDNPSTGQLHFWRKQVQRLRYQLQLLASANNNFDTIVEQLARLSDLLGDDHDLAVLETKMPMTPAQRETVAKKRKVLQEKAFALASGIVSSPDWPLPL